MKAFIANNSTQLIGGGWSWVDNITKALPDIITGNEDEAGIVIIPSASMIKPEEAQRLKNLGKKIVLRIDNALRNTRNSGHGMSRMKTMAELADRVVYQSEWARQYLLPFLKVDGVIIHNSVDESIFNSKDLNHDPDEYIYSRYNRDETKNWEVARYTFAKVHIDNPQAKLTLIGRFSEDLLRYDFDFYNGENWDYLGVITDPQFMAHLYRRAANLIYTFYMDACSNTLIEALLCGMHIVGDDYYRETGGAKEIIWNFETEGPSYFSLARMGYDYKQLMEQLV